MPEHRERECSGLRIGVFRLEDNGWLPFGNLANSLAGNVKFLGLLGDTLVAGAGGNGYVWFAPPGATSWDGVQVAPLQGEVFIIYSMMRFNEFLYTRSTYGIHQSADNGSTVLSTPPSIDLV